MQLYFIHQETDGLRRRILLAVDMEKIDRTIRPLVDACAAHKAFDTASFSGDNEVAVAYGLTHPPTRLPCCANGSAGKAAGYCVVHAAERT